MKRFLSALVILVILGSCNSKTENTMTVSGNVKGLKKGTLYLQQFKDSTLVILDSIQIQGNGNFEFAQEVPEPEIFYLYLDKADNNDVNDRITFFGEAGEITINTAWNTFALDPTISGSESHIAMTEFNDMMSKFNIRELELVGLSTQPEIQADSVVFDSIKKLINHNGIGSYRYAINYGLTNSASYATPYLVLSVAEVINPTFLDSIYNNLSPEVAASKYGKDLKAYLNK